MLQALSDLLTIEWLGAIINDLAWSWPILEMVHFMGLVLLVGITGAYDLRLLGFAKSVPLAPLHQLMPWALVGFGLCLVSGIILVTGNAFKEPIVLFGNVPFMLKMLFIALAGVNAAVFYRGPMHRAVGDLGHEENVPRAAKIIAASSLVLWIGVIYFGRMIPWHDAILYALGL